MASKADSKGAAIDKVLEDFGSSLYDYITEKDIIKAAAVYTEKPMYKAAHKAILAILAQEVKKARIDEMKRLNLYYLQHDGEGEHQLAAQFDKRINQLERLG